MRPKVIDVALKPWDVAPAEVPDGASFGEIARMLLRFAILAPNSHNTQPWRFAIGDSYVDFFADRARRLEVVDPNDRSLVISVAAAIETFSVAAEHFGFESDVQVQPAGGDEPLIASVSLQPSQPRSHDLFAAIPHRRTTRMAFEPRELPGDLLERVRGDAIEKSVELSIVTGDRRSAIAGLVSRGDVVQLDDVRFRRELASWVRPNNRGACDGMRGYGFGFSDLMSRAGPFVIRTFDSGKMQGAKDRRLVERSPALLVFATPVDAPEHWVATGRVLMRILLRLTAAGATASFLNQPIEIPELRPRLAATVGLSGLPQLLLRCGYGPTVRPEPRRPIEDVLVEQRRDPR
jgi:hypothetical protein